MLRQIEADDKFRGRDKKKRVHRPHEFRELQPEFEREKNKKYRKVDPQEGYLPGEWSAFESKQRRENIMDIMSDKERRSVQLVGDLLGNMKSVMYEAGKQHMNENLKQ